MYYLILSIILTIIYYRLIQKDKREEEQYQMSRFEIFDYGQRKGQDRFIFHELECVNQYAHQKNYQRDILNYKTYTGENNQGVAKKVYHKQYNPVRKASGELVTPDEAYTDFERSFSNLKETEFEFKMCSLIADRGFYKDAYERWIKAKKGKRIAVVTAKENNGEVEWDYQELTSKHLQPSQG